MAVELGEPDAGGAAAATLAGREGELDAAGDDLSMDLLHPVGNKTTGNTVAMNLEALFMGMVPRYVFEATTSANHRVSGHHY